MTASTKVSLSGGNMFKLSYRLAQNTQLPNYFTVYIGSIDNSFLPMLLNYYINSTLSGFYPLEQTFSVPTGTRTVTLTFTASNVRPYEAQQRCWSTQFTAASHCQLVVSLDCFDCYCPATVSSAFFLSTARGPELQHASHAMTRCKCCHGD
jgi:hypothetical protein